MNLLHLLAALLVITTLAFTPRAHAATLATPTVAGLAAGVFQPASTPAVAGSAFSVTGAVTVSGKTISVGGTIPPAANASSYARAALFSNPWLQGALLALWPSELASGDLVLSGGAWNFVNPPPDLSNPNYQYRTSSSYPWQDSPMTACQYSWSASTAEYGNTCNGSISRATGGTCYVTQPATCGGFVSGEHAWTSYSSTLRTSCPAGYSGSPSSGTCTLVDPVAAGGTSRPATQDDFNDLPDPSPGILAEMAPQIGVPVAEPTFEPADVPIGTPYTKPDGSTAQTRAKISPASDGQVWIDVYEIPLTDAQGDPVQNPTPQDQPETDTPSPTQCDKYPNTLGCARLDPVPDESLGTENRDVSLIQPVDLGGAGTCPAPLTATVAGMTIEWSFDALCQYANALRPLVLALAWLSAGTIFIGGVRNG